MSKLDGCMAAHMGGEQCIGRCLDPKDCCGKPLLGHFDAFWKVYPKRLGANPKNPARTKFDRAVSRGANPQEIIQAAKSFASDPSTKVGTEFVPMASTWLFQRRWEDYLNLPATPPATPPQKPIHGLPYGSGVWLQSDTAEWVAWKIVEGHSAPIDRQGGWVFPSRWPPDFDDILEPKDSTGNGLFPLDNVAV